MAESLWVVKGNFQDILLQVILFSARYHTHWTLNIRNYAVVINSLGSETEIKKKKPIYILKGPFYFLISWPHYLVTSCKCKKHFMDRELYAGHKPETFGFQK